MFRRFMLCVTLLFLAAGCTTTNQAMLRANEKFVGKNIDEFVLAYSPPYAKHTLNSGDLVYLWNSGVLTYNMPGMTTMSGSQTPYGFSASGFSYGGGTARVFCEIQIMTSESGIIQRIQARTDTLGRWTTSRCSEVFR